MVGDAINLLRDSESLGGSIRKIPLHAGAVRGQGGGFLFPELLGEARDIGRAVRKKAEQDSLVQSLRRIWPLDKMALLFQKKAERWARTEVLRIGLVAWMAGEGHVRCEGNPHLHVRPHPWVPYLRPVAEEYGVHLETHGTSLLAGAGLGDGFIGAAVGGLADAVSRARSFLENRPKEHQPNGQHAQPTPGQDSTYECDHAAVGIPYWRGGLSLDPRDRSELFWTHEAGIPPEDVIIFGVGADPTPNHDEVQRVKEEGFRLYGSADFAESWYPGSRAISDAARLVTEVYQSALNLHLKGDPPMEGAARILSAFAPRYTYWRHFFHDTGIQTLITPGNVSIAQVAAIDELGGATVSYQYSTSNLVAPLALLTTGADVNVVFSSAFKEVLRASGEDAGSIVIGGFPYDSPQRAIGSSGRYRRLRKGLVNAGADYIVAFFDENSGDTWDTPVSNQEAARDYDFLARWVLEDPQMGLLIKPKVPETLLTRLGETAALLEEAIATRRCKILGLEEETSNRYPAEVALAADLCIGKLTGTTAALECFRAGTPTVIIDTESTPKHPFQGLLGDGALFGTWSALRKAVAGQRDSERRDEAFGDLSEIVGLLDPFQDGKGTERLADVVESIHRGLVVGEDRNTAISEAKLELQDGGETQEEALAGALLDELDWYPAEP